MNECKARFIIVGGGPAGISAALAIAESGDGNVALIDDNPRLGGQIWRSERGRAANPQAQGLFEKLERSGVTTINNAQIFGALDDHCLLAETNSGPLKIWFEKLILATGAREQFLPFPNWTLPNVFGAGGLQALVKSGLQVKGKRIIVAGTGPLLLAVADYLNSKGANVLLIAEQTPSSELIKFGAALWRQPVKIAQAIGLRARLSKTRYLSDCFVTAAAGTEKLEAVNLTRKGKDWSVECDFLASGFHLVPNTELASLLGCRLENGFVAVDHLQETSIQNVFCAGEPTGIGGVDMALIEGRIAGMAAVGNNELARRLSGKRARLERFSRALNSAFRLRPELKDLADDATIICRCEDVRMGRLRGFKSWRTAKLETRSGMGACQARICGPAVEFLLDWQVASVRPPILPVRMDTLADLEATAEAPVRDEIAADPQNS